MKNISLCFVTMLVMGSYTSAFSQKCETSSDPITNETLTKFNYRNRMVYYEQKKGETILEMMFTYGGELNVTMPKGTELLFKLESGEILKLLTVSDAIPKSQVIASQYSAAVITYYSYVMGLSKSDLSKLASSKVVLIRFPNGKGGTDDFVPSGRSKKIAGAILKGAGCMSGMN